MKLLIDESSYNLLQNKDIVLCSCVLCNKEFTRTKKRIQLYLKRSGNNAGYCSRACANKARINHVFLPCEECSKVSKKRAYDVNHNKHVFCSCACHAKYKNKNKKGGINRSAIEIHIESLIRSAFPALNLICNDHTILDGQELDFYFPTLKFAIELNGITHYEPIYGLDRFTRSLDSDKRKMIKCYEKGIELAVIDISAAKTLTKKWKQIYWNEVNSLLSTINKQSIIGVADDIQTK